MCVVLTGGRRFIDKLVESKSKYYRFEKEGRVLRKDIRSFATHKGIS
jgi:hypothetical protein